MTQHILQLATGPFEAIKNGKKTIESRLYDEKRQQIELGDTIEFINRGAPDQRLSAKVVGFHRYETFEEMFQRNDPAKFGGESSEWLLKQINQFYSNEQQAQYGVLGIEFDLM